MFEMPSIKREGQTMLNMCMEQCEGVYLMNEIERLREAMRLIAAPSKIIAKGEDMAVALQVLLSSNRKIAIAALKEGE